MKIKKNEHNLALYARLPMSFYVCFPGWEAVL